MGGNLRPVAVFGLLLALMLVAAACGGDVALSKDEYIAQGNAICEDTYAQLEAQFSEAVAELPDEFTPEEFAEMLVGGFLDQFTVAIEQQLVDLRALAVLAREVVDAVDGWATNGGVSAVVVVGVDPVCQGGGAFVV